MSSFLMNLSRNIRYGLEANEAILAGPTHDTLTQDIMKTYPETLMLTAGGSTQNTIRVAQWILSEPHMTTFLGSVGNDSYGKLMKDKLEAEGVTGAYVVDSSKETGRCAVLLTNNGLNRCLVSFHGAARSFQKHHVTQKWPYVKRAKVIYSAAFTIAANFDPLLELCHHSLDSSKVFCLNLSAVYICQTHVDKLKTILPFVDIFFGNRSEFEALSSSLNLDVSNTYYVMHET